MLTYEQTLSGQSHEFEGFLTEQEKKHREFLESYYSKFFNWVGVGVPIAAVIVGAVFSGFFTWLLTRLNAGQIKDAKDAITAKLGQEIDQRVQDKVSEFKQQLAEQVDALMKEERAEFQKKLDDFQKDIDSNKERAKQQVDELGSRTEQDFYLVVDYASNLSYAAVVLSIEPTDDPQKKAAYDKERLEAIESLSRLQDKVTRHRTFNIFLARLYRDLGDYAGAIHVLSEVLKTRAEMSLENEKDRIDHAALFYNRACYRNLLGQKLQREQGDAPGKRDLLAGAWEDLKACVRLSPKDLLEAKSDSDFDGLIGSAPERDNWDQLLAA